MSSAALTVRDQLAADTRTLRKSLEDDLRRDYGLLAIQGGPGALAAFLRWCWPIIEPGIDLEWGPHLDLLCATWQRWIEGEIRYLLVMQPPGTMKSVTASVVLPAFDWLHRPHERALYTSGNGKVSARDSRRCRDIIRDPSYIALAALAAELRGDPPWGLKKDQQEKLDYVTTQQGQRFALPLNGYITGQRGGKLVVDDPTDAGAVVVGSPDQIKTRLEEDWNRFSKVLPTRLNDQRTNPIAVVAQGLHPLDLPQRWIQMLGDELHVLCLPMEYDPDHPQCCPDDWRTQPGELLEPVRFPQSVVDRLKRSLGPEQAAAQLQHRPISATGGLIRREHFQSQYSGRPRRELGPVIVMTCDLTFKGTSSADYVACGIVAIDGVKRRPLDVRLERADFKGTLEIMRDLYRQWRPDVTLVEDKANGPAALSVLEEEIPGLIGFNPGRSSKYERAQVLAMAMAAGQWEFPEDYLAPWLAPARGQCLAFPDGSHDDAVDMWSQLEIWAREHLATREPFFG